MNKKKGVDRFFVIGLVSVLLLMFMSSFVFAALGDEARTIGETVVSVTSGLFGPIINPLLGDSQLLSRFFMAILLGMIIYSITFNLFKMGSGITWILTISITSLSMIAIPESFLKGILIQYGAMGATILTMIPFIIILYFSLSTSSLMVARITWIVYIFYFLSLYLYNVWIAETFWSSGNIPYFIGFIAGLGLLFGIGWIRNLVWKGQLDSLEEQGSRNINKRKTLLDLEMERLDTTAAS